jgi:predicted AlkP superfamily phosphohydrolase/phosphomutase
MVSCFLTPSLEQQHTYPPPLRREVERVVGEYLFDCTNFRTDDKANLLEQIYTMTDRRFKLADHFLRTKPWDLFAMVEIGVDRIHHAFWKDLDPKHRRYDPNGPYANAIREYYDHVDKAIAGLLQHADDDTVVLVVSDHGAKRMDGGIRINEWLRREGLLATKAEPSEICKLTDVGVDWSGTVAWSEGGYYARIFMNVRGREPEGIVDPADYERVRDDLARRIEAIPDENGKPIGTKVFKPEDVYPEVKGVAPDLIVHFGDLLWRSIGTIGGDAGIHVFENDTGPDDANHAQQGILIMAGPGITPGEREGMHLLDVAPTVLSLLDIAVPDSMRGESLL